MDYLQYANEVDIYNFFGCFKPYYKWITFNTEGLEYIWDAFYEF